MSDGNSSEEVARPQAPRVRLGVFGGAFNPIHMGHLIMAQDAMELFELSQVIFIPCARPPHKSAPELASAEHRLAMVHGAVEGDWRFEVSDMEIQRGGISWSVDTARELRRLHPEADLVFIIGADMLPELYLWRDVNALLELCRFVTLARPGTDLEALRQTDLRLDPPWSARLKDQVRVGHLVNLSSTDIRYRIAEGLSIRYLVHPAVDMYIAEHRLYRK